MILVAYELLQYSWGWPYVTDRHLWGNLNINPFIPYSVMADRSRFLCRCRKKQKVDCNSKLFIRRSGNLFPHTAHMQQTTLFTILLFLNFIQAGLNAATQMATEIHTLRASGFSVIPMIPTLPCPYLMKVVSINMSLHIPFDIPLMWCATCSPFKKWHKTCGDRFSIARR